MWPSQGRSHQGKMLVVGAVEIEDGGRGPGRIRLSQVNDYFANRSLPIPHCQLWLRPCSRHAVRRPGCRRSETVRFGSCAQSRSTGVTAGAITRFLAHCPFWECLTRFCTDRQYRMRNDPWARMARRPWELASARGVPAGPTSPGSTGTDEPGRERITVGIESFL